MSHIDPKKHVDTPATNKPAYPEKVLPSTTYPIAAKTVDPTEELVTAEPSPIDRSSDR